MSVSYHLNWCYHPSNPEMPLRLLHMQVLVHQKQHPVPSLTVLRQLLHPFSESWHPLLSNYPMLRQYYCNLSRQPWQQLISWFPAMRPVNPPLPDHESLPSDQSDSARCNRSRLVLHFEHLPDLPSPVRYLPVGMHNSSILYCTAMQPQIRELLRWSLPHWQSKQWSANSLSTFFESSFSLVSLTYFSPCREWNIMYDCTNNHTISCI